MPMKTNNARTVLYTNMYIAISKATAETSDAKGNAQKNIFNGITKDLFKDAGTLTITKFLWAVSHKTDILPTVLFRVISHGNKDYEIERLHSGFRNNETGNMVTGIELVPYIMAAAKLYKTTPRATNNDVVSLEAPVTSEVQICDKVYSNKLESFSDEELLAELQRREDERKAAAELARKKALVEEFLAAYDLTMNDLLEIAQVI